MVRASLHPQICRCNASPAQCSVLRSILLGQSTSSPTTSSSVPTGLEDDSSTPQIVLTPDQAEEDKVWSKSSPVQLKANPSSEKHEKRCTDRVSRSLGHDGDSVTGSQIYGNTAICHFGLL